MSNSSTYGDAGAGQTCDSWSSLTCYSSTYKMRSLFRMDTHTITQDDYKIPSKAVFKIVQRHSASCSNGTAKIWRTGGYNADDTWNTQPDWYESVTISSANNGATCDGSAYVAFNVTSMVDMAETNEWTNLTLGLRANDESPSPDLLEWNRFDSDTAVLEITYDVMPYMPKDLWLNGATCTAVAGDAPWISDRTPAMSARIATKDATVKWTARLRESGSNGPIMYEYTSGSVSAGYRQYKTVPWAQPLPDGSYYWLAQAMSTSNSDMKSSWSPACRFLLDGTKPSTPTITPGVGAPYSVGESLSLTLTSTDPVVNGVSSGIVRFEYSWEANTYDQKSASTGTLIINSDDAPGMEDGLTAGRHVLYIRSVDAAGNFSDEKAYTFFAGNDIPATPMATWRFEGDTFDDTGEGHDLTLAAGDTIEYTTDRDSRANSALALDGATCLHTSEGVIFTKGAYSLAAWVRLDAIDNPTDRPLAQIGDAGAGFQIWYSATADLWYFSVLDANQNWYSIGSAPTAELGEWEHIAATYDPDAGLTRLYLGGNLVSERTVIFDPWNANSDFGVGCKPDATAETAVNGAIDQVGVWQGLLSATQIQAAMTDLPGARKQVDWTFRNDGTDESGYGRGIDTEGLTVGSDPYNRPSGAVELDGASCLEYPTPVVATDRSFTVATWVKVDNSARLETIVSIAGENNMGLRLRHLAEGKFQFRLVTMDAAENAGATVRQRSSTTTAEAGQWYHIAGVYDASLGQMQLYVNGVLEGSLTIGANWQATGTTLVGCAGTWLLS